MNRWRQTAWSLALPMLLLMLSVALVLGQVRSYSAAFVPLRSWAEIGTLAALMTAVVLTGGIDLSVGSTMALAGVVCGACWQRFDWPIGLAAAAALATGLAAGGCNGCLVVAGASPLVATLATMAVYSGLATAIASGQRFANLPAKFCQLGQGSFLGLPTQFWIMALVFIATAAVVHHMRFGRYLFAIGDNRLAAQFAAVPVRRVEWKLYAAMGLIAALTSLIYAARGGAIVPELDRDIPLKAIACVVLGGTRVTGGAGGVWRTLLGVLVLAHLDIGLAFASNKAIWLPWRDTPWRLTGESRQVAIGLLVIAVAVWNERAALRRQA